MNVLQDINHMGRVARQMRSMLLAFLIISTVAFVVSDAILIGTAKSRVDSMYELNTARTATVRIVYQLRDLLLSDCKSAPTRCVHY